MIKFFQTKHPSEIATIVFMGNEKTSENKEGQQYTISWPYFYVAIKNQDNDSYNLYRAEGTPGHIKKLSACPSPSLGLELQAAVQRLKSLETERYKELFNDNVKKRQKTDIRKSARSIKQVHWSKYQR